MRFRTLSLSAVLLSLFAFVPGSGYGQSPSTATTQQPAATTAPPPPPKGKAAPLANTKPVKVWTNDEIDILRNKHSVSVVGNHTPQNVSANSKPYAQEKDPAVYRRQLAPLRGEIDKLDAQIAKMQAFLNGENVGEQASLHPKMVPSPQVQLKQMEAKRQADAAKVDELLDRARHNGIEPGALR
jgi:hypothetical protein